ncbi:MAG: ABC transporter permease [Ignavibacteriales bacterium]|nr:ABC transporter permease [Ignavibacteriales bacterium]
METFRTIISEFIVDLKAQKLRAFLTMFGIIWGTVAIVVLVAFGVGFRKQTMANMHGIGEGLAIVWPGKTTKPYAGYGIGRSLSFVEEDTKLIAAQVPNVSGISPEFGKRTPTRVGENILTPLISGVNVVYGDIRNINPEAGGRYINTLDIQERRRVAVIGDKVKEFLFAEQNAIGKTIFIGRTPFTVIGVMQKKTQPSSYNSRDQDRIFIPLTTFESVYGSVYLNNIIYQVRDPRLGEETAQQVREALSKKYRFDPTDQNAVWIWDTTDFDRLAFYMFLGINIFLGLIGSFTLGVAGLGVANIMFIVVQERIKEIGVKRAVGATKVNILFQFFSETFFIVFTGSAIGFIISYGIIAALSFLPIKEYVGTPILSMEVVLITVFVLITVGLLAGLMPARRASNLDVVECLRT